MFKHSLVRGLFVLALLAGASSFTSTAEAAPPGQPYDWGRFNYYPYVYYPHNFSPPQEYDSLYYRYPQERRIPVYNSNWHNFYPTKAPYHRGHAFILDVF